MPSVSVAFASRLVELCDGARAVEGKLYLEYLGIKRKLVQRQELIEAALYLLTLVECV